MKEKVNLSQIRQSTKTIKNILMDNKRKPKINR